MKRLITIIPLVLAASIGEARPQTLSTNSIRLNMKTAVQMALEPDGSTRARMAHELVKQAEAQAAGKKAALLPEVTLTAGQQDVTRSLTAVGLPKIELAPGIALPAVTEPFRIFDVRGTASMNIFDLSALRRYQSAETASSAAKAEADSTYDSVSAQVAELYIAAVRAQAVVQTAQADTALSEALLKLAISQKDAGVGTGIEVTRAQVQLADNRQREIAVLSDLNRAQVELLGTIGIRLDSEIEFSDELRYVAAETLTAEQAMGTARESLAALKAQELRETSARQALTATKMERLPTVQAFADYGSIGSSVHNSQPTRTFGVNLKVPVFDGGRREARISESRTRLNQEKIRTADLLRRTETQIRIALNSVRSAEKQVEVAEEGLTLSNQEMAQAERRYRAGVASSIEVTDAQTRLQRAQTNRITALFNHNLARIELAAAMGDIQRLVESW